MSAKKTSLSVLLVVLLTVSTILGVIPLTIHTPSGIVSVAVKEAEAQSSNVVQNRARSITVRNTGARLVESFAHTRNNYTVNVREVTDHANMRIGLSPNQQVRWRIDTRRANGTWNNGTYNAWRARTTSNTHRDVRVNVSQGQERRLRFQIRSTQGNIRTLDIIVRRASANTWGANLRANAGTFDRSFTRTRESYTLQLPRNRTHVSVSLDRAHHNAEMRLRFRDQNNNGTWGSWDPWWMSFARSNRTVRFDVGYNNAVQVQFQIRGAFTSMPNTPTHTRTYTVTVRRSIYNFNQQWAINWLASNVGFSRQRIINDMVRHGFSGTDATRAVDSVRANWNAQAVIAARRLVRNNPPITRQQMINGLVSEGFTQAQATHGANAVGL